MQAYSHSEVDVFLWEFIEEKNLDIPRYAVEFGALDGITNSNIRLFLEKGWSGLWIEPSVESFGKLENNIEGLDVEIMNFAVADFDGTQTFYYHDNHPGGSSLIHHSKRWFHPKKTQYYNDKISYEVECKRLVSVLGDRPVGLMTIDAEDMDTRIVKDLMSTPEVRPHIVMSEGRSEEEINSQQEIMSADYDLVTLHGRVNSIFIKKGTL